MNQPASPSSPEPPRPPRSPRPPKRGPGFVTLVIGLSLAVARDQRMRRSILFFVMLAVMGLVFTGAVFLDRWLSARPWVFLIYWGICLWLTLLAILLALYDLLMVRSMAGKERRRIADEMKSEIRRDLHTEKDDDDSNPGNP